MPIKSKFRLTYPKARLLFDGGLNTFFQKALISDNESPDCQNVVIENGAVATRQGSTAVASVGMASAPIDGLFTRHARAGTEKLVAFCGGSGYYLDSGSFTTIPSAQDVFSEGYQVVGVEYENYLFMGNGQNSPYKYNGTEFTKHGITTPDAPTAVTATSVGVLTGDYTWRLTGVNSNLAEGERSAVYSQTVSSKKVTLSGGSFPISYGVEYFNLYRNVSSGSTFLYLTQITNAGSAWTFTDNVADASLGATEAPSDAEEPPNYSAAVYHQDRLFVNDPDNPNLVRYSDLGEPYTFASTNFLAVGNNTQRLVRAFSVYENSIVVFTDDGESLIYMPDTDPANWSVIKIKSSYGCKSPLAPIVYNNKVLFPAVQSDRLVGFAALNGASLDPGVTFLTVAATGSDFKSAMIDPDIQNINAGKIDDISGIVFKNKAYISVAYGLSASQNNRVYVYDFSMSTLSKKQEASWVPLSGIMPSRWTIYDSGLYFGSSKADGLVYQLFDGTYNDSGEAIDSYYWTKEFSGYQQDEEYFKDFRYAHIFYKTPGDWDMNFTYKTDSTNDPGTTQAIDLDPGGSLWGAFVFGDDWGGNTEDAEKELSLGTTRGKRIQFKFDNQNTADQYFKIYGLKFSYNKKGAR